MEKDFEKRYENNGKEIDVLYKNIKNIKVNINVNFDSMKKFKDDLGKIPNIDNNVEYVIVEVFLQLGSTSDKYDRVFDYKKISDITVLIQPKIKNYITFKSKKNALNYIETEFNDDVLYMLLKVHNGHIYTPYL